MIRPAPDSRRSPRAVLSRLSALALGAAESGASAQPSLTEGPRPPRGSAGPGLGEAAESSTARFARAAAAAWVLPALCWLWPALHGAAWALLLGLLLAAVAAATPFRLVRRGRASSRRTARPTGERIEGAPPAPPAPPDPNPLSPPRSGRRTGSSGGGSRLGRGSGLGAGCGLALLACACLATGVGGLPPPLDNPAAAKPMAAKPAAAEPTGSASRPEPAPDASSNDDWMARLQRASAAPEAEAPSPQGVDAGASGDWMALLLQRASAKSAPSASKPVSAGASVSPPPAASWLDRLQTEQQRTRWAERGGLQ